MALHAASFGTARVTTHDALSALCSAAVVDAVIVDDRLLRSGNVRSTSEGGRSSDELVDAIGAAGQWDVSGLPMPVLLLMRERPSDGVLRSIYAAGYWSAVEYPLGTSAWIEQLRVWTGGSLARRRQLDLGLVDPATGLYNARGLAQRAREVDALGERRALTHTCAVFVVEDADRTTASRDVPVETIVARACDRAGRASDVFARIGERDFAVLALDTDVSGLHRLVERLASTLDDLSSHTLTLRVRQGGRATLPGRASSALDLITLAASGR